MPYATQSRKAIAATLSLLKHYRAFLASDCREMRDPFEITQWRDGAARLDKTAARRDLAWLVHVAISRKGGACLPINDARSGASYNHRGRARRKEAADYQRGLLQDANDLNRPRLIIRQLRTPALAKRFADRITKDREV